MTWATERLGALTTKIGSGATPTGGTASYKDAGIPFIRSMNVRDGSFDPTGLAFLDEHQGRSLDGVTLAENDVLLNITGASVARVCRLPTGYAGGRVNQHVAIIRPKSDRLDPAYLAHCLGSPQIKRKLLAVAGAGATREAITKSTLESFEVPVPPLPEQRRIAAILDEAEALRAKRRAALAHLDEMARAIFVEMFGDPQDNTLGLETHKLSALCTRITDGTHQSPKWAETGIPFLFVSNIIGGEVDFVTEKSISEETYKELTRQCPIEAGDILYSTVGSYGIPALVRNDRKFAFQRHIGHIKPNRSKLHPEFLLAMLRSPGIRAQADRAARGVAQKTINLAALKDFLVFCPPLSRQEALVSRTKVCRDLSAAHQEALVAATALFTSLQHRAFRGEL